VKSILSRPFLIISSFQPSNGERKSSYIHILIIIMLAYLLAYHLRRCWSENELTVEEGIAERASICAMDLIMPNGVACQIIPDPRPLGQRLLERVDITLPDAIPRRNVSVVTRKQLVSERKVA
jgi:hypothetical protein